MVRKGTTTEVVPSRLSNNESIFWQELMQCIRRVLVASQAPTIAHSVSHELWIRCNSNTNSFLACQPRSELSHARALEKIEATPNFEIVSQLFIFFSLIHSPALPQNFNRGSHVTSFVTLDAQGEEMVSSLQSPI